jgi:hypothetical protein
MNQLLLFASTSLAGGLLFVNIYTSLIDAKSWGAGIPQSLATAREYFKTVDPKRFFRMIAPANLVVALLVLILFWNISVTVRIYSAMALALYVGVDIFTFTYFYPRNKIMFETTLLPDIDTLKNALTEWRTMNWLRSLIIFAGLVFSFLALHEIYAAK